MASQRPIRLQLVQMDRTERPLAAVLVEEGSIGRLAAGPVQGSRYHDPRVGSDLTVPDRLLQRSRNAHVLACCRPSGQPVRPLRSGKERAGVRTRPGESAVAFRRPVSYRSPADTSAGRSNLLGPTSPSRPPDGVRRRVPSVTRAPGAGRRRHSGRRRYRPTTWCRSRPIRRPVPRASGPAEVCATAAPAASPARTADTNGSSRSLRTAERRGTSGTLEGRDRDTRGNRPSIHDTSPTERGGTTHRPADLAPDVSRS